MVDPTPRTASFYVGDYPFGASRPQQFFVDGVGHCLVKFSQSPQGPKLVVNEFIGFSLASLLGIPHPRVGVVNIEAALLPDAGRLELPETRDFDPCTFEPGLHVYSQFLDGSTDRLAPTDLRGVSDNGSIFAGVVLLDILLSHWDRGPGNMNLLLHRAGQQRLHLIDLGHSFGGGELWSLGDIGDSNLFPASKPLPYANGLEAYFRAISNPVRSLEPYLTQLASIDTGTISAIVEAVPNEWQLTALEAEVLVNYLSDRVAALPNYMNTRLERTEWWR